MKLGFLQWDIAWLDIHKNLDIIQKHVHHHRDTFEVLILPEMFSTGYVTDTNQLDKTWQDTVSHVLTNLCQKFQLFIMGSIPYFKDNQWHNTFCVWSEQGIIHEYDKMHLFSLAGEHLEYSPGTSPGIFTNHHWKIAPFICYDLRFPAISVLSEFPQLFIFVANWPGPRIHHWECLLQARAIENQAYVVGVNRLGMDENGYSYPGKSMVFDFSGKMILDMQAQPGLQVVTLDLIALINYRNKYPFLKDRVTW